jgi:DNA-binding LytR/AlgR family response regulator
VALEQYNIQMQLNLIRKATETYFSKQDECVEYRFYQNGFIFLDEWPKEGNTDILLLDICMPGILGTDVAKALRKNGDKTEIIFLTTSTEFAVEAFSLKATHYLVKPFTQNQFNEAMDRAMLHMRQFHNHKIMLRIVGGGIQVIDLEDVIYIESTSHTQTLYLQNGKEATVRQSLSKLLTMFDSISKGQFASPFKGYIVNLAAIRTIKPEQLEMVTGKQIPLIKREYRQFQEKYFAYIFQEK